MLIYCKTTLPIPQSVKTAFANKKIDGVTILTDAANFFGMNGGFNNSIITTMLGEVRTIGAPFLHGTIWGWACGNYIYNNHPTLQFVRKHHVGIGEDLPINIPVFYCTVTDILKGITYPFFDVVRDITNSIAGELKRENEVYELMQGTYITGCNETTLEMRVSSTNFAGLESSEQFEAFYNCAMQWIAQDYRPSKSVFINNKLIELFYQAYPDKLNILQYILGLNSHPCVNEVGNFVKPQFRSNPTTDIITYGQNLNPFFRQSMTYFNSTTITNDRVVEVQRDYYSLKTTTDADFEKMVEHAELTGVEILQCHLENINKYKMFK